MGTRKTHGSIWRKDEIDAGGERYITLAQSQALAREVCGDQGGRAGGVQRDARSSESQEVGEPPSCYAEGIPGTAIGIERSRVVLLRQQLQIIAGTDSDENTGPHWFRTERNESGVFQGVPADLKENSLLRVQHLGFARRNAEEGIGEANQG